MDFNYLHQYAEDSGKELCDKFFNGREQISGSEVLRFTPIKQVNFFILRILFQEWKKEASKLESPFFDFNKSQVQQGLKAFMEVLSHHISVHRVDFEPIVQGAIEESILLATSPDRFFKSILFDPKEAYVSLEQVLEAKKYLKINNFAFKALEEAFKDIDNLDGAQVQNTLDVVFLDRSKWYDANAFLEQMNDLFPLDIVQLVGKLDATGNHEGQVASINEHHQQVVRTLNDELVGHGKLDSLKTAFNLNQRFAFIKHLFDGNENLFTEAVGNVDKMLSYEDAVNHLLDTYSDHFKWGKQEELVAELFDTMNKRF